MSPDPWGRRPFESVVRSRGSGSSGLPQSEWTLEGAFPVIGQGAESIEGWTDREDLLLTPDPAVVLYGGHTRRAKHVSAPFVPGPNVKILSPVKELDSRFLFYYLGHLEVPSLGYADHFPLIRKCEVPVPPLDEQQRIVGVLDEAFDGIAKAKANADKNLDSSRAVFESHLQSVFTQWDDGWLEMALAHIGTTQTGSTPRAVNRDDYGDFIPFVKPADFNRDGSLDYDNEGLSERGLERARRVQARSVLMVCIGATIGKCAYCDRDVTANQQINTLTPFPGVFYKFVYYQMLTESFKRRVLLSSSQATLPIINKSKWSALTVRLPATVQEQEQVATKCDTLVIKTQRLESVYQKKHAALDELKKSLLHEAFSGRL